MEKEGYTIFTGPIKNGPKGNSAIKLAEKNGQQIEILSKLNHYNKHNLDGKTIAKIMDDEENHKLPTMPHQLRLAISQARNQKKLTQEKFAQMLCVSKSEVNAWENGKALPATALIVKMDKILGVKLPRPPKK